ncbi:MAG: LysR substrate-binding domain-containing protein [Nitrosomonas sp.]
MRVLADRGQCLVASPVLVHRFGLPAAPGALSNWPSLGLGILQQIHAWALLGPDGANVTLHHTPRFVTTDMIALRDAAVAGVGVVQLPMVMARDQLAAGHTRHACAGLGTVARIIIHAVFPSRRGLLPSVRALIDFLAQRFEMLHED